MRGITAVGIAIGLLGFGLFTLVSEPDSIISSAPTPTAEALPSLGSIELLTGAYGCDNAAAVADSNQTGSSNDPICHFDNFSIPDATVQCTADGGVFFGNPSSGALSNSAVSVSHDGTYLDIALQPGVTLLWSFIKAGSNHNHYATDLVGLHGPAVGNVNNPNVGAISHWGLCYIPVSPV